MHHQPHPRLTIKILLGMLAGIVIGALIHLMPPTDLVDTYITRGILEMGGTIFITLLRMLVVPIVFVSLVCGTCHLGDIKTFGRLAIKTFSLYLLTTSVAISLGLVFARAANIGAGQKLDTTIHFSPADAPSFKETIINIFPSNPIQAMAEGNMLQIILFAILLGSAIALSGNHGKNIAKVFKELNEILMKLISMVMRFTPYGVFCLLASLFAKMGYAMIGTLFEYFITVLLVLFTHLLLSNSILLKVLGRLSPITFFKKMYAVMIFAFSTSSSNASIPITLDTVENKLGVNNSIAAFTIPLGATVNMDGTAIMQGVATVFIANAYQIPLVFTDYLLVIITATLASIGTAGVPSAGLIMLAMVLKQVGLPVEGIALIIGVDRILDMLRTAVNVTGDAAVSCVVAKSERQISEKVFYSE